MNAKKALSTESLATIVAASRCTDSCTGGIGACALMHREFAERESRKETIESAKKKKTRCACQIQHDLVSPACFAYSNNGHNQTTVPGTPTGVLASYKYLGA